MTGYAAEVSASKPDRTITSGSPTQPPGISVSLQVENKQFIGNGHLIGLSLR